MKGMRALPVVQTATMRIRLLEYSHEQRRGDILPS